MAKKMIFKKIDEISLGANSSNVASQIISNLLLYLGLLWVGLQLLLSEKSFPASLMGLGISIGLVFFVQHGVALFKPKLEGYEKAWFVARIAFGILVVLYVAWLCGLQMATQIVSSATLCIAITVLMCFLSHFLSKYGSQISYKIHLNQWVNICTGFWLWVVGTIWSSQLKLAAGLAGDFSGARYFTQYVSQDFTNHSVMMVGHKLWGATFFWILVYFATQLRQSVASPSVATIKSNFGRFNHILDGRRGFVICLVVAVVSQYISLRQLRHGVGVGTSEVFFHEVSEVAVFDRKASNPNSMEVTSPQCVGISISGMKEVETKFLVKASCRDQVKIRSGALYGAEDKASDLLQQDKSESVCICDDQSCPEEPKIMFQSLAFSIPGLSRTRPSSDAIGKSLQHRIITKPLENSVCLDFFIPHFAHDAEIL